MIKHIKIKNFKCIDDVDVDLAPITLIVGRNNTGKTSILHAIKLMSLKKLKVDFLLYDYPKYLIKYGKSEAKIKIDDEVIVISSREDILMKKSSKLYDFIRKRLKRSILNYSFERINVDDIVNAIKEDYVVISYKNKDILVFNPESLASIFRKPPMFVSALLGIEIPDLSYIFESEIGFWNLLYTRRGARKLIKIENLVREYNVIDGFKRFQGEYVIFDEKVIPISLFGDGFKKLISVFGLVVSRKEKTILLDEPAIYMHPGYVEILVRFIIDFSKDGYQFIIATHNVDFIEAFLSHEDKEFLKENFKIIRMTKIKGKIKAVQLSYDNAFEEMEEIKWDLRGI